MARVFVPLIATASAQAAQPSFEDWAAQFAFNGNDSDLKTKYEANVKVIEAMNAENSRVGFAVNQFSGMDQDEWKSYLTHTSTKSEVDVPVLGLHESDGAQVADSLDWEQKGAVTPVKNQGSCGSCWSFGSTGSMEGHWFVQTNNLVSLSEQQLMDCDKSDDGCGGGDESSAISYASRAGMCSEASYSYQGRSGRCQISSCDMVIQPGDISGYRHVGSSVSALMSAVQLGPVNLGVGADGSGFQSYSYGVLTYCPSRSNDHAVLLVGYGTDQGDDYWRVKNSWGSSWGERGYIRISRQGDPCGILDDTGYPQMSGSSGLLVA